MTTRRVLLVAGPGRSGTSAGTLALRALGYAVPQPEVPPDDSNPRGFAESRWVVRLHNRLLRRAEVGVVDPRPEAWERVAQVAGPKVRARAGEWLAEQLAARPALVVKDPRLLWFLPLWRQVASEAGATVGVATMLRHPTAVLHSRRTWYAAPQAPTTEVAAWLNAMLGTEASTRDMTRGFVLYDDLLADWRAALSALRRCLGSGLLPEPDAGAARQIDELIDPRLRRSASGWGRSTDVPVTVRDLADRAWSALAPSTGCGGLGQAAALDRCRDDFRAWSIAPIETAGE